jgi:hypothetical protein
LALNWVVGLTAVATFILGIVPGPLLSAAERALLALFAKA